MKHAEQLPTPQCNEMTQAPQRLLVCLSLTLFFALARVPVIYGVDGCSSPGFKVASTINLETNLFGMAVADFNGDGHLDLVVSPNNYSEVRVFLGKGGTDKFGPPTSFPTGAPSRTIAVGDFNGDGRPDLAVCLAGSSGSPGQLSILLNDGTGKFGAPKIVTFQGDPARAVIGDVNNDGKLDIITALSTGTTDGKAKGY